MGARRRSWLGRWVMEPGQEDSLRFGVLSFGIGPYERLAERWQRFEELGFDHARVTDDLLVRGFADFESWTLLAALARDTRSIEVGTLLTSVRLRHPALLAAEILSVDQITGGGRVAVGIGSGEPEQNETLGAQAWEPKELVDRLHEQLGILSELLRGDPIAHGGGWYPTFVKDARRPDTRPRPPIIVAAHGISGMRIAARYADGWNCLGGQPYAFGPKPAEREGGRSLADAVAETRRLSERLDEACEEIGREPSSIQRTILAYRPEPDPFSSADAFDAYVGAYDEIGISSITFYWPPIEDQLQQREPSPSAQARFEQVVVDRIRLRSP